MFKIYNFDKRNYLKNVFFVFNVDILATLRKNKTF